MHHIPMCLVFYTLIWLSVNLDRQTLFENLYDIQMLVICISGKDLQVLPGLTEHSEY